MDGINLYQIILIVFVALTNIAGIGLVWLDIKNQINGLGVKELFCSFWQWCIFLVLSFCAYLYLGTF